MNIKPLRMWVQNILPVVYDDSLSYLEMVAKINAKTNEIISQTNENTQAIESLTETIAELGDIEELRALIDEIEAIVEDLYTTDTPLMDGTASAGSANHAARSDHVHPSDTTKLDRAVFDRVSPFINNKINNWNAYTNGKVIFIGNSYAQDPGTNWKKWPTIVAERLSLGTENTDWWNIGRASCSMTKDSTELPSFINLLRSWVSTHGDEIYNIGAIVTVAGINDADPQGVADLPSAMQTLTNYIKQTCPNASAYYGYTGFKNYTSSVHGATDTYESRVLDIYQKCAKYGGIYFFILEKLILR